MSRSALALAAALALLVPVAGRAQLFMNDEIPQYTLSGRLFASYGGTWSPVGGRTIQSHILTEGAQLDLGGWIYQSRLVKFRAFLLANRLDELSPHQGSFSLGYGGALLLFSRSILPVSLAVSRSYAIAGSNVAQTASTSTTVLSGSAQLVSPVLPHADLRAQHQISQDSSGASAVSDDVNGGVYGGTALQRYAGVVTWDSSQFGLQPRTVRTMASLADDIFPSLDTRAHVGATITQGSGFGGASYTGYDAEANVLTRLGARAVARAGYSYSELGAASSEQTSHQASGGATIDLKPLPLFLGEGISGGEVRLDAPGLREVIDSFSVAQGIATSGRSGKFTGTLAASGQLGYTSVAGGSSGRVVGYGLNGVVRAELPGAPTSLSAQYARRDDYSSAETSTRILGANLITNLTRHAPLLLLPSVNYLRIDRRSPMVFGGSVNGASTLGNGQAPLLGVLPGTGGLLGSTVAAPAAAPASQTGLETIDSNNLTAGLTGVSPLWRTRASFAAGYNASWSDIEHTSSSLAFARFSDAFRVAYGSFGNLSADLGHTFGGGTSGSLAASVVWSLRESTFTASYTYTRSWPGAGANSVALLYSRAFGTSFLPESR